MASTLLVGCLCLPASAGKKPKFQGFTPHRQENLKIEIEDIANGIAPAQKACANYAWAAAAETILKYQNVFLKQVDFVVKANGGAVCLTQVNDFDRAVKAISGDYALDDGRKIHVNAEYLAYPPGNTLGGISLTLEPIALALKNRIPVMLMYSGRPLLLYGVIYDENTESSGRKTFPIKELWMMDPQLYGKPAAKVSFVNGKDDPAQIQGMMSILVSAR